MIDSWALLAIGQAGVWVGTRYHSSTSWSPPDSSFSWTSSVNVQMSPTFKICVLILTYLSPWRPRERTGHYLRGNLRPGEKKANKETSSFIVKDATGQNLVQPREGRSLMWEYHLEFPINRSEEMNIWILDQHKLLLEKRDAQEKHLFPIEYII